MNKTTEMRTSVIDSPRKNIEEQDYFGIDNYARSLAQFIKYSATPITIAIQGEWGSGKSSLMNYINKQLCSETEDFHGIWLNTWEDSLLTHEGKALTNVVSKILDETVKVIENSTIDEQLMTTEEIDEQEKTIFTRNLEKIKGFSTQLKPVVNSFLGNAAQVGIRYGIEKVFKDFGLEGIDSSLLIPSNNQTVVDEHNNKDEMHKVPSSLGDIKELRESIDAVIKTYLEVNSKKKGFIFFIDDLDRLEPTVAVDILEILKNIFTIENCVFILAIDYEVIVQGLKNKFGERNNSNEREFRSFFDKIIQVPFTMPVNNYEIETFLIDKLDAVGFFNDVDLDKRKFIESACKIIELSVGHNPRSLKRLINALSLTKIINANIGKKIEGETEHKLHFLLVCIQTVYPKIYSLLQYEPAFKRWGEMEIVNFSRDKDLNEIDFPFSVSSMQDPWKKTLFKICMGDSYLKDEYLKIVELLSLIEKIVPEELELNKIIENMLQKSIVTNVSQPIGINFTSEFKKLREAFDDLKKRIGRTPFLYDFTTNNSIDPNVIVNKYWNYQQFLLQIKEDVPVLSDYEDKVLTFLSLEILNGKRRHEIILLELLLNEGMVKKNDYIDHLKEANCVIDDPTINSVKRIFNLSFFGIQSTSKYGEIPIVILDENNNFRFNGSILESLQINDYFNKMVWDIVKTSKEKSETYQSDVPLTLYKQYTRKDACKLLNWTNDESATIYGYKIKHNTCPIFVTYHVNEEIESSEIIDKFINHKVLNWFTRFNRTLESKEVKNIINAKENNLDIHIFVKKDNDESRDFYYLGKALPDKNTIKQSDILDKYDKKLPIVQMNMIMENNIESKFYDYIISDENDVRTQHRNV
ncbi:TPA: DUF3427 domain-containing protein [Bacillus toyonensis]|uniref:DUF3427 domain-containing protein n=1 Tax=Bacillus TaxID=1386 RepID=UPI0001A0BE12|nr:DUF3427 domain-containing protein [Bacillus toyonensis]EEL40327.1 Type III restriction protein res subunit [Bacillus cereus Rock3-29]KAB0447649.1 DUF3427 domain-containing protein [Lysinibacillus sp. VIA-II-2016]PEF96451.1 DUF3427 domain-containing protein [Bacillus toyonensis]PEM61212.1 DUF3427 domain-containing protein [Bacillus toyonensis]HDR7499594.1 DUF3427 domain-containing protein [Bacillus toyonensis]